MEEIKRLKCVDSKGRTKFIVEPLATNAQWMKSHELTLIEEPQIKEVVKTVIKAVEPEPEISDIDPFEEKTEEPKKIKLKTKKQ